MGRIGGFFLRPIVVDCNEMRSLTGTYEGKASWHYGHLMATQSLLSILKECGLIKLTPGASKMLDEKIEELRGHHGGGGVNQKFFEGFWIQMFFILSRVFHSKHEKIDELARNLYPFKPEEPSSESK